LKAYFSSVVQHTFLNKLSDTITESKVFSSIYSVSQDTRSKHNV